MKAISLLSGGLDSILATKADAWSRALNWRPSISGWSFATGVRSGERPALDSHKAVESLGIPLKVIDVSEEYLEVVKHPKHGYGSNMNPCIDCRIFMMKKAKEHMEEDRAPPSSSRVRSWGRGPCPSGETPCVSLKERRISKVSS